MADKAQKKTQTIDEAAREAGFKLGATVQPGGIMLAGFGGTSEEALTAAAQAANRGGIRNTSRYRCMFAVDGLCVTIETNAAPQGKKEG